VTAPSPISLLPAERPDDAPDFPRELFELYEPSTFLGRGRSGTVWRATERATGADVALKFAERDAASAHVEWVRCRREHHAMAKVAHPRILSLRDGGLRGRVAFWAAPLVPGGTLADVLARGEALPVDRIVAIVRGVGEALTHAASRGVIHGRVSPSQILLDEGGAPVVSGFRTSLREEEDDAPPPPAPAAAYLAPEQRGRPTEGSEAADQYALALIAYELFTGEVREGVVGTVPMAAYDLIEVSLTRALRPGLPTAVNEAIQRATSRDPAWRFPSAEAFGAALADACAPRAPEAGEIRSCRDLLDDARERRERRARIARLSVTLAATSALVAFTSVRQAAERAEATDRERAAAPRHDGRPRAARIAPWKFLARGVVPRRAEPPRAAAPPAAAPTPAPPQATAAARREDGRVARVDSGVVAIVVPGSVAATLVVDGAPVAPVGGAAAVGVPSLVRLPAGPHLIALRHPTRAYAPAETTIVVTGASPVVAAFRQSTGDRAAPVTRTRAPSARSRAE
jgi:hypothetical protein